jgi:hypothetical protein
LELGDADDQGYTDVDDGDMTCPSSICHTCRRRASSTASDVIMRPVTTGKTEKLALVNNAAHSAARSTSWGPMPTERIGISVRPVPFNPQGLVAPNFLSVSVRTRRPRASPPLHHNPTSGSGWAATPCSLASGTKNPLWPPRRCARSKTPRIPLPLAPAPYR